jgi:catechol 2,3-dioxygenase-like lactoylglutathione lyase family enzyme
VTQQLPPHPNLDWLKKAAKDRLAELRERDAAAALHQAQLAIAQDYGFKSWRALKAHVDAASLDGRMIAAAVTGDADGLQRLLSDNPPKLGITGGTWNRPLLHLAAEAGHIACVDVLIGHGVDVNLRDKLDNACPLHWAASQGRLAMVQHLVGLGADVDGADDEHEMNVIGWATLFQGIHQDVADYLIGQGAKPTLFASVALGRGDLVKALVKADPRTLTRRMSRFEDRRTLLHLAVLKDRADMVELLLALGADPVARDDRGYTPLSAASPKTDPKIAALLIAAGASPREQTENRFESAVPILNVKDVPASIAYYEQKLGFQKEWDWGSPPTFACVHRDAVRIFLCLGAQGGPGTWISIFVRDVDALFKDYQRTGAIIRQVPTNFPWGVREMNVEDLDGHRLRMGGPATDAPDGVPLTEA